MATVASWILKARPAALGDDAVAELLPAYTEHVKSPNEALRNGVHWLASVGRRIQVDAARDRAKRAAEDVRALDGRPAASPDPADTAERRDLLTRAIDAVRSLPRRQRVALIATSLLDLSPSDVAAGFLDEARSGAGFVADLVAHARRRLRAQLSLEEADPRLRRRAVAR